MTKIYVNVMATVRKELKNNLGENEIHLELPSAHRLPVHRLLKLSIAKY